MSHTDSFQVDLELVRGYEFNAKFYLSNLPDLRVDENAPIGSGNGPSPDRLLGVAVAHCLAASLLFCLHKSRFEPDNLRVKLTGELARNEEGRLRICGLSVRIEIEDETGELGRILRCSDLFEDFCVVSASVRSGIPIEVEVVGPQGDLIHRS